jgi:hypothetical protein
MGGIDVTLEVFDYGRHQDLQAPFYDFMRARLAA